jgi:hypothetical protein
MAKAEEKTKAAEKAEAAAADTAAGTVGTDGTGAAADAAEKEKAEAAAEKENTAVKTVAMTVKHKSHTRFYYRCGIEFTQEFRSYDIPEDKAEKIKTDTWLVVKADK